MAVAGREPSPNAVNRNVSTVEWIDIEDKPYTGKRPALPKTRTVFVEGEATQIPLNKMTTEWWEIVSKMPHAAIWTASDWLLAQATALVHDAFVTGTFSQAPELRRREQELGMTAEARRKLRIRYIEAVKPAPKPRASRAKKPTASTPAIDIRRQKALETE
jgi:hypothetical protein